MVCVSKRTIMLRATLLGRLFTRSNQLRQISTHAITYSPPNQRNISPMSSFHSQLLDHTSPELHKTSHGALSRLQIGENVPRREKMKLLFDALLDMEDKKEVVYNTLDTWVAWEKDFPIGPLKTVLIQLEKEQQWHKIIQVIKWILSKGQGRTMGTYEQLIRALDMDHRVKEAHAIWKKKVGSDFHSVPWRFCSLMISIYYRNNMLHDLVKLFKGLEKFDRKPPEKSIVQKVANAYEMLGKQEEKERVLEKYKDLFTKKDDLKKSRKPFSQKKKSSSSRSKKGSNCHDSSNGRSPAGARRDLIVMTGQQIPASQCKFWYNASYMLNADFS